MKKTFGEVSPKGAGSYIAEIDYDIPLLRLPKPSGIRSKRNIFFLRITDAVRERLAAGLTVTEMDIQPLCRGYPGDSRKALKKVHQCYRRTTRLFIDGGIYRIEPVTEVKRD